jgi:hypothetical protein
MNTVFLSCLFFGITLISIGLTVLWWEQKIDEITKKYIDKKTTKQNLSRWDR